MTNEVNKINLTISVLILLVYFSYVIFAKEKIDNKRINAFFESQFQIPIRQEQVKNIVHYAHNFTNIRKQEGNYGEAVDVAVDIDREELENIKKYIDLKYQNNHFYFLLNRYLSDKATELDCNTVQAETMKKNCHTNKDVQLLFLEYVTQISSKDYFINISQLAQITQNDYELDFLIFLQDVQLGKFSSRSIHYAFLYQSNIASEEKR